MAEKEPAKPASAKQGSDEEDEEEAGAMTAAYSMTDLLDGLDVDDSNMLDPDIESSVEVDRTLTATEDSKVSTNSKLPSANTKVPSVNSETGSKVPSDSSKVDSVNSKTSSSDSKGAAGNSNSKTENIEGLKEGVASEDSTEEGFEDAVEEHDATSKPSDKVPQASTSVKDERKNESTSAQKSQENVKSESDSKNAHKTTDSRSAVVEEVYEEVEPKSDVKTAESCDKPHEIEKSGESNLEDSIQIIVENEVYESADRKPQDDAVYVPPEAVRERKRESASPQQDAGLDTVVKPHSRGSTPDSVNGEPPNVRIRSDISGRFQVEGAEFSDTKESIYYNDVPPEASASGAHDDDYYNEVEDQHKTTTRNRRFRGTFTSTLGEELYENVGVEESYGDDGGWSSSEFESYEDDDEESAEASQAVKRKKEAQEDSERKRSVRSSMSPDIQGLPNMLEKIAAKWSSINQKEDDDEEDEETLLVEVILNAEKHPLPQLPPTPQDLSTLQVTRRQIVANIVDSERSYMASLRRILENYEKPLLETKPSIVSKRTVRVIFFKVRDILRCHNMFQIELAEAIREWDTKEMIGNVFTAAFSKSMVFDAYSAFVNNYSIGMETARKMARTKQSFAEFFKQCEMSSPDKLSFVGLMVKPVQRFPQFIMFIQDLLKQTPTSHPDCLPLQMALSELETLTHKINETKRESDNRYDAKKVLDNTAGHGKLKSEPDRYMVRQDDMTLVERENGETKTKLRRLFLMNDQLMCCSIAQINESGMAEKYKYKWSVPISEVEVITAPVRPNYQVFSGNGRTTIKSLKASNIEVSENNPFRRELDDMLHDLPLVEQMGQMVSQLRLKYQGLNLDLLNNVVRTLQIHIQQKSDIDKCIIQLNIPVKGPSRQLFVFKVASPAVKQNWMLELSNTKLALDPRNNPSWQLPESELQFTSRLPLFIQPLLVNITNFLISDPKKSTKKKYNMKVQCGTAVVIPAPDLPRGVGGLQHVWVISGDKGRSQVAVVALLSSSSSGSSPSNSAHQPRVVEAFRPCDELVLCAESVPLNVLAVGGEDGQSKAEKKKYTFDASTVWLGTDEHNIHIFYVEEDVRKEAAYKVSVDAKVLCLRYLNNRVYAGLKNGTLLVFSRDQDGVWNFKQKTVVKLMKDPVMCLLAVGRNMWAAAGHHLHIITLTTQPPSKHTVKHTVEHTVDKTSHKLGSSTDGSIQCLVRAGVGVLVAFSHAPVIRLFHLETLEHLQDVSVQSGVNAMLEGHRMSAELAEARVNLRITYLLASKGLLWVGTNVGCILTLPLPRLDGVPQMKVRATVSHHAHTGPVTFLLPVHSGMCPMNVSGREIVESSMEEEVEEVVVVEQEQDYRGFTQSDGHVLPRAEVTLASTRARSTSTPDIRLMEMYEEPEDNLEMLYGSLMKGLDEPDIELYNGKSKRRSHIRQNMQAKATALNAKITQTVSKITGTPMSPAAKYATLPILSEDAGGREQEARADLSVVEEEEGSSMGDRSVSDDVGSQTSQEVTDIERSQESNGPSQQNLLREKAVIEPLSQHSTVLSQQALGKHITIVSGGTGYVNWNASKKDDLKYDDMCLLLWQCRL